MVHGCAVFIKEEAKLARNTHLYTYIHTHIHTYTHTYIHTYILHTTYLITQSKEDIRRYLTRRLIYFHLPVSCVKCKPKSKQNSIFS